MIIKGKVWKYGDDINTDVIFPGKYTYTLSDPAEMARVAMEDLDEDFAENVEKGDIIVGGTNFGCGSSREQAASCLVYAGVGAIIAKSFSRIYFRNCINFGLPALVSREAVEAVEQGDELKIDIDGGKIYTSHAEFDFPALPEEVMGIFDAGGLIPYTRKQLGFE